MLDYHTIGQYICISNNKSYYLSFSISDKTLDRFATGTYIRTCSKNLKISMKNKFFINNFLQSQDFWEDGNLLLSNQWTMLKADKYVCIVCAIWHFYINDRKLIAVVQCHLFIWIFLLLFTVKSLIANTVFRQTLLLRKSQQYFI